MAFAPSKYQQAVFDWILTGTGNAVVNAVAGSGKTTSLVEALSRMVGKVAFFAFNKHISEELKRELDARDLRHIDVSTIHSFGFAIIRKQLGFAKIDDRKYNAILKERMSETDWADSQLRKAVLDLTDLARGTHTKTNDKLAMRELAERHNIDANGDLDRAIELAAFLVAEGTAMTGVIDFTDMLWFPYAHQLRVPTFSWVCIDEAQDLNRAQQWLVTEASRKGRALACGDPAQSIYGFAGADTESIPRLIETLKAIQLPLSICYRCPASHVELAREIVPTIEARPDAPVGVIETVEYDKGIDAMRDGDMVVCRVNAPLAKIALRLIRSGVKAVLRGRDISTGLINLIEKHGGRMSNVDDCLAKLSEYITKQATKLRKVEKDVQAAALEDKFDTIMALSDGCHTVPDLRHRIETIFTDSIGGVVCSSVHRAKGLQADHVFVYRRELMPHPMAKRAWERVQERNLQYVSVTRAKATLTFVECDPEEAEAERRRRERRQQEL
jgi:DNA helicase-2/ATP-dependent DNA helicase PcrA